MKAQPKVSFSTSDITFCDISPPYDEVYLNKQLDTLEKRTIQSWVKMLEKAEKRKAYKLMDFAKLKMLPLHNSMNKQFFESLQYDQYYLDIINFIQKNSICDKDPNSYYNLGLALLCIGDYFRGSSYLIEAEKNGFNTTEDEKPYIFGIAELSQKQYQKAIEHFTKSIENFSQKDGDNEIDADSFMILFYSIFFRGYCYKQTNYMVNAAADFSVLQNKQTRYLTKYDIAIQLADVFAQDSKNPSSLSQILTLAHIGTHLPMREYFYAKIKYFKTYEFQNEYALLPDFQQSDRDLFIMNVYSLAQLKKYLQVVSLLKDSLETRRMDHAVWYLLGFASVKLSLFQQAEIALQNAYILNPTNVYYRTASSIYKNRL